MQLRRPDDASGAPAAADLDASGGWTQDPAAAGRHPASSDQDRRARGMQGALAAWRIYFPEVPHA